MGRMQRDKGAAFERAVAATMRTVWPQARRGIGQSRSAREVPDVDLTPYWVECKRHRRCNVQRAYRQACEDTDGRPPVVVTQDNRGPVLVTMSLYDWLRIFCGGDGT